MKKKLSTQIEEVMAANHDKFDSKDDAFSKYKEMAEFLDKNFPPVVANPITIPYITPDLHRSRKTASCQQKDRVDIRNFDYLYAT